MDYNRRKGGSGKKEKRGRKKGRKIIRNGRILYYNMKRRKNGEAQEKGEKEGIVYHSITNKKLRMARKKKKGKGD